MVRRPGLTLTEVLVAIFIMGIGMMALLVMFPLGAINMATAIKDDQTAHASSNANSWVESFNLREDPAITPAFSNPGNGLPVISTSATTPSYPVYVDGLGQQVGGFPGTVGGLTNGIPRRSPSYAPNAANARRFFTLLDNITFDKNGVPTTAGGEIERETRFTWAYLLRRPRMDVPIAVDVSIVVYSGRSTVVAGETAYPNTTFSKATTLVVVPYAGRERPAIKKGGWVLDGTMTPQPRGFFYRVAEAVETVVSGQPVLNVELETKPQEDSPNGVLLVLDDVVEVFNKGQPGR